MRLTAVAVAVAVIRSITSVYCILNIIKERQLYPYYLSLSKQIWAVICIWLFSHKKLNFDGILQAKSYVLGYWKLYMIFFFTYPQFFYPTHHWNKYKSLWRPTLLRTPLKPFEHHYHFEHHFVGRSKSSICLFELWHWSINGSIRGVQVLSARFKGF